MPERWICVIRRASEFTRMDESVYELRVAECNIDSGDSVRVSHRGRDEKTDEESSQASNIRDVLNPNFRPRHTYGVIYLFIFINYSFARYIFFYILLYYIFIFIWWAAEYSSRISVVIIRWKWHFPLHKFENYIHVWCYLCLRNWMEVISIEQYAGNNIILILLEYDMLFCIIRIKCVK